ncbi:MAG: Zn peptidase [Acidobacteria bacterium]|nr:MAG: Zn peptidase [Acidobacteriota bacterium]
MSNGKEDARKALRGALEVRKRTFASKSQPICVYDTAEQLGLEVIFRPEHSLGGIYAKASQLILVPAHRPLGRQAFTCAHEIGHWYYGHGTGIDEIDDLEQYSENKPEERLADIFASYLLMPPWAVNEAYARRGWNPSNCTPIQVYTVAGQLGVGYQTLVQHLRYSLRLISSTHAQQLLKITPKKLRHSLLGSDAARHLLIVDCAWTKVSIDLQVGDMAILPTDVRLEGESANAIGSHELGLIIEGHVPGIMRVELHDRSWAAFVRVSRKDFTGRSIYRHLEDPDVDESSRSDI